MHPHGMQRRNAAVYKEGIRSCLDSSREQAADDEFCFLAWEDIDYLVTIRRSADGRIRRVSTHCLLADSVYNGWILRQQITEDGDITETCLHYWI